MGETTLVTASRRRVKLGAIFSLVLEETGIPEAQFKGPCRKKTLASARQAASWLAKQHVKGISFPLIGRHIGGRDHSTIMHAVRRAEMKRDMDPEFRSLLERIETRLREDYPSHG